MKKKWTLPILLLGLLLLSACSSKPVVSNAQIINPVAVKKIFTASEMVWFGIDFSQVKLVGSAGFTDPHKIRSTYFAAWNTLIQSEPKRYDLKSAFRKSSVIFDTVGVTAVNAAVNPNTLVVETPPRFHPAIIPTMVASYPSSKANQGIGAVFVVESFNKTATLATIHVVLFDIRTREVLLMEKMTAEPGGFGLRNYWAGSIREVIEQIESGYYAAWQQNYGATSTQ